MATPASPSSPPGAITHRDSSPSDLHGLTPIHSLSHIRHGHHRHPRPDRPGPLPRGFLADAGADRRDVTRPGRRIADGAADHASGPLAGAQPALVADRALLAGAVRPPGLLDLRPG